MHRRIYQFKEIIPQKPTAGQKAVEDVTVILSRNGAVTIRMYRILSHNFRLLGSFAKFGAEFACRLQYWFWSLVIARGSIIVLQHPVRTQHSFMRDPIGIQFLRKLRERRNVKIVTLIHDIVELREGIVPGSHPGDADNIVNVMSLSDALITHNSRMTRWFVEQGFEEGALVELGLFDYLSEDVSASIASFVPRKVVYPGYLGTEGKLFLTELKHIPNIDWCLYGMDYSADSCQGPGVTYCGAVKAEDLPVLLQNSFLLVWDGDSIDGLKGKWGEYFKIISPHKLSLAMASGVPVITCSGAYAAEFVEKHGAGMVLESLRDLPKKLNDLTTEEYKFMVNSASRLSEYVRSGGYLKSAIQRICEKI